MAKDTATPAAHLQPGTSHALEIRRTIRAPRQRVFEAWTRPEELKKWHAPGPLTVPFAEVELRVGGTYRVHMLAPDGAQHNVVGTYREVDPPSRLVYSWSWESQPIDSVVTIEFHDRGDSTEVVLRHALPNEEARAKHEHGWIGCLAKLEAMF